MIGTGVSQYTTALNLCHIRVTLESSVDHTPDGALSFLSLDLGQTRGAASLVSMLSHTHVQSISLDVTPSPLSFMTFCDSFIGHEPPSLNPKPNPNPNLLLHLLPHTLHVFHETLRSQSHRTVNHTYGHVGDQF